MNYVDSAVLDFTERMCRQFQAWTGRTNVWLAFQLTNLSIVVGAVALVMKRLRASPRAIAIAGGVTLVDKVICRAERHLDEQERWGAWSHALVFEGRRVDGHHWVIESDLQIHRKHIQLGVQENRIAKYFLGPTFISDAGSAGASCTGFAQAGDGFAIRFPVLCKLRLLKII